MKHLSRTLTIAAFAGLLSLTAPAFAQGTDPAAADALFQKGREAAEKGDWATACPKFAESQRLDPAAGTLLNLADCEEHLGQLANAWEHFKQATETMPANDDRVPFAKDRASKLEKQVPHLTMTAAPDLPSAAKVTRDDIPLGTASFGLALPVNPGNHTIVITAPGHKEKRVTVTLKPGESQSVTLSPGDAGEGGEGGAAAAPASTPALSTASTGGSFLSGDNKKLGYIIGGVGVAAVAIGAVTGIMVLGDKSTVQDPAHCDQITKACDQTGVDAASAGKTMSTVSTVAFAAGLVGVGVGAYFILTSKDSSSTATLIGPSSVPGGAGLRLIQTF